MSDVPLETPTLNPQAPSLYFNGFSLNLTNSDISIHLLWNGAHTCTVFMSFTTAKTVMLTLADVISKLEQASGNTIMDITHMTGVLQGIQNDINS